MELELATLRSWKDKKGFGFADSDLGGAEIFVHARAFNIEERPARGDRIEIEVEKTPKGLRAKRASVLKNNVSN